jgi:hypothetical protein
MGTSRNFSLYSKKHTFPRGATGSVPSLRKKVW